MIAERALRLGPLGRRLLAAFLVVALVSVALVTAAALIGTTHGITANRAELRAAAAQGAADAAAEAYVAADGWQDADLRRASAIATAAGARLVVRDAQGEVVSNSGPGEAGDAAAGPPDDAGAGGAAAAAGPNALVRPVVADDVEVGSVRVGFGPTLPGPGQQIAWTWTLAAAIVAMLIATIAAWFVARRITGPLNTLMGAVRGFAAGDRTQRAQSSATDAPGELGELARSFNSTADSVALSEATRRRMAADVAHELRTPLAALQAGLEELTDGYLDPEPEVLRGLHAQSVRLARIVADLSELTNAESASLSMARVAVDVGEIAADAVDAATPVLAAAGVAVRTELAPDCCIAGDADRLHQALTNMLSNAARYCRPGDEVKVAVSAADSEVVLTVADTGPGIPSADLDRVFERLWRGTADSGNHGLGIGLAVVKSIVVAHGGTVAVVSEAGAGAQFQLRFPRLNS